MRRRNRGAGLVRAGTGEGEFPRQNCSQGGMTTARPRKVKQRWSEENYPDPSPLPGPPLAKPEGKAVGRADHRDQHPKTRESNKNGEWTTESKESNQHTQQFHSLDTPLRNSCILLRWDAHKKMHKDVLFSIIYTSEALFPWQKTMQPWRRKS